VPEMIDRIRSLESVARRLEPGAAERAAMAAPVLAYGERFLQTLPERLTYVAETDGGAGLYDSPIGESPAGIDALLRVLDRSVDLTGINPTSAGHFGYIPGGGLYPSALGDYLAAVTNRYAGVFFANPGAVRMEHILTRWMGTVVGFPESAAGNLTSGGSIATLIGIVTARDAHGIKGRDADRAVIYFTEHAHHSVGKAIRIAGLGDAIMRRVPMDRRHRMDADALNRMIAEDRASGLRPFLVIASAGTTDVGAVDPLPAIADVADQHRLWLHVDGAYGAFFALCGEGRKILAGMDRADSIIMDPHKGLFLPYGSGAVLVKNAAAAQAAHDYTANYMQDAESADEMSPADLSPELTKHFRGLRLWLPLKLFGVAPFRAALEEKMWLARYFRDRLMRMPGFEVGPEPDLSVVTFRYVPDRGDADEFNQRLVQAIHDDGRVFLSSSVIDGQFIIRLAVLVYRSHIDDVDLALEILEASVKRLLTA
jgi:glutamate/tyrosine decarboxylase-like PLP-dependent enzyme